MIVSLREGQRSDLGGFEEALQGWFHGRRDPRHEAAGRTFGEFVLRSIDRAKQSDE